MLPIIVSEKENAKNWVKKAISFYEATGKEISLAEFANPRGQFVSNSLYVFALDLNGVMLAHPVNEKFAGKNFLEVKDSDGKSFIREVVECAAKEGGGFVDYKWCEPVSKGELPKTLYFERADGMIVCSGFYGSRDEAPSDFWEYLQYVGTFG